MPKALHDKLSREAKKKSLTGKRKDAFVYGTLNKVEKKSKIRSGVKRKKNAR